MIRKKICLFKGEVILKKDLKIVSLCFLLLLFIILSTSLTTKYLKSSSDHFVNMIKSIEKSTNSNQWQEASSKVEVLYKEWKKTEDTWAVFVNHHEIDSISTTFLQAIANINMLNKAETLSNLYVLMHYIKHIPEIEKLNLKNIL